MRAVVVRVMSPAWERLHYERARRLLERAPDKLVRGMVRDFAAEMIRDREPVAAGAVTMTTAVMVSELAREGDFEIGGFVKDWLDASASQISTADSGEAERRIMLTSGARRRV